VKITLEGTSLQDIFDQMDAMLLKHDHRLDSKKSAELKLHPKTPPAPPAAADPFEQGPGPEAPKGLKGNDGASGASDAEAERIRKRNENLAKGRATRDANKKAAAAGKPAPKKVEPEEKVEEKPAPSPVDMVAIRTKTVAELQSAYASGKHAEVLELLSRFGNGAKSFRELPAEAFGPIREAIDLGALT
jgi:hypothetical protein